MEGFLRYDFKGFIFGILQYASFALVSPRDVLCTFKNLVVIVCQQYLP